MIDVRYCIAIVFMLVNTNTIHQIHIPIYKYNSSNSHTNIQIQFIEFTYQHNDTQSYVFIKFVLHNEQVGFEKRVGQKRFFRAFPMYCHILNFSSCLI